MIDWKKLFAAPGVVVLAILALVFLIYGQALSFGYAWDDYQLFLDKASLLNEPLSWNLLAEPILPHTSYMRPLVMLTWYAEFHWFGQVAWVSHLVNLVFFAANALLVHVICRHLAVATGRGNGHAPALLAAVIYVVHPALVESAAWVSGRFDLLVTFFMLLGVWAWLALGKSRPALMVAAVSLAMFCALLSKELGVILPALILCVWAVGHWDRQASLWRNARRAVTENAALLLALVATFAVYLVLRDATVGSFYHASINAGYLYEALIKYQLSWAALKSYLAHSFVPFTGLGPYQPIDPVAMRTPLAMAGNALALAFTVGMVVLALRRGGPAWCFVAWLVGVLPVLHFIPLTIGGNLAHDRFLTASLAFMAIGAALAAHDLVSRLQQDGSRLYRGAIVVLPVWALLAGIVTVSYLPFWSSDLVLGSLAYRQHPDFQAARSKYLYGALRAGRRDLVKAEVEKRIRERGGLDGSDPILYASVLRQEGNAQSLQILESALSVLPRFHEMEDGRERIAAARVSMLQIAFAYQEYASALMEFRGDLERAQAYNRVAEWYLLPSERFGVLSQRVGILHARGEDERARVLEKELEKWKSYRKEVERMEVLKMVARYCDHHRYADKNGSCQRLKAQGFFDALVTR